MLFQKTFMPLVFMRACTRHAHVRAFVPQSACTPRHATVPCRFSHTFTPCTPPCAPPVPAAFHAHATPPTTPPPRPRVNAAHACTPPPRSLSPLQPPPPMTPRRARVTSSSFFIVIYHDASSRHAAASIANTSFWHFSRRLLPRRAILPRRLLSQNATKVIEPSQAARLSHASRESAQPAHGGQQRSSSCHRYFQLLNKRPRLHKVTFMSV